MGTKIVRVATFSICNQAKMLKKCPSIFIYLFQVITCSKCSILTLKGSTIELHRRGFETNHKVVYELMNRDNLLCIKKQFVPKTTDSEHNLPVYPNLAKNYVLTGINQLWAAGITYIRLVREFIYLAVIIDVFSRKCIGWKYEEVYLWEYETYSEAHKNIKKFLEIVYNKKRVHSSIGYVTPEEFEMLEEVLSSNVS